ncbi:hypothetical protein CC1G_03089 [Coprinopsis cinerea okayama7|uniref:Uncharacterized protein n=1 Tax=Coprinopsis cinerea (strain Okayama-7 / 130 / ATCC MYA-4618 / FGSC 9003) TaxID=240176 RepID=A8PEW4_COPC7|nr:hypothetical protein CC1G_03089 [Coprinopsis cinerea okayama7\|eukprot:XP_001840860.1 hypothetical protein CC1G_03089 [Coprinopsis cinerea okayama7\
MKFSVVLASLLFAAGAYAQSSEGEAPASDSVVPTDAVPSASGDASGSASGSVRPTSSASGSGAEPEPTEDEGAALRLGAPITLGAIAAAAGLLL